MLIKTLLSAPCIGGKLAGAALRPLVDLGETDRQVCTEALARMHRAGMPIARVSARP